MYIKKKDRLLFEQIDNYLQLPSKWEMFINKQYIKHNLIIKKERFKNSCLYYCTNCHILFEDNNIKINGTLKCPNCNNKFLVKSNKLRNYKFNDYIGLLDKYQEYYIIRGFEIVSYYDGHEISNHICEYQRDIYNEMFNDVYQIVNDNVVNYIGGSSIVHREEFNNNWRYYHRYYYSGNSRYIYYPYNIKKLLNNTPYQYSQLWILCKKMEYFDIAYLLREYNPCIELLIKLKLYNLALNPRTFAKGNTFKERFFGLTKDYLPFIQKYNLDVDELETLSIIKYKNIKIIRKLTDEIHNKRDLAEYIDLAKSIKLTDLNLKNSHEYADYLSMCKKLKYDMKDKKILYPNNIKESHDKVLKLYELRKNKVVNNNIQKRYKGLVKNIYKTKKYIIFPAKDYISMIDESSQQNNCVKTYAEKYAAGKCDIYFMRLTSCANKSLVTVEVRNNKVYQKRTKNNEITTKEQDRFLNIWESKILSKEGVKN